MFSSTLGELIDWAGSAERVVGARVVGSKVVLTRTGPTEGERARTRLSNLFPLSLAGVFFAAHYGANAASPEPTHKLCCPILASERTSLLAGELIVAASVAASNLAHRQQQ